MGAFDCGKGEFVFHDDFFKDIAQRRLCVNPSTSFPIISLLRIDKYKQRGYQISRKDFINLCFSRQSFGDKNVGKFSPCYRWYVWICLHRLI